MIGPTERILFAHGVLSVLVTDVGLIVSATTRSWDPLTWAVPGYAGVVLLAEVGVLLVGSITLLARRLRAPIGEPGYSRGRGP